METRNARFGVLFVCLGNICRSPVARAVFRDKVNALGKSDAFRIDSCGTGGWHAGESAHPETIRISESFGVSLTDHRARQIKTDDLTEFDLIVAMDRSNLRNIKRITSSRGAQMILLREFDPLSAEDTIDVPDPWGCDSDEFVRVHQIIDRSCEGLLRWLLEERNL